MKISRLSVRHSKSNFYLLPTNFLFCYIAHITKGRKITKQWGRSQETLKSSQILIPFQCTTLLSEIPFKAKSKCKEENDFFFYISLQGLYILYISRRNLNDQLLSYDHCYFQSKSGGRISPIPVLYSPCNRTIPFYYLMTPRICSCTLLLQDGSSLVSCYFYQYISMRCRHCFILKSLNFTP